jgi:hypothetical protein
LCESRKFYDQEVPSFRPLSEKHLKKIEEDKQKMKWRTPVSEQPGTFKTKFSVFTNDELEPSTLSMIAQPIDFSPTGIKNWWKNYKVKKERFMQMYIPERHAILGNDLGAAHFLLYRKGKVKFIGQEWLEMKTDDTYEVPLPNKYDARYLIEAIDCENMELYYEGLENIRRLKKLKSISFKNVKLFDDWCLDRVSGSEFDSLEELNISGTIVTPNGLQALYRVPTLRKLILDIPETDNSTWHLTIAMLQDINPNLETSSSKKL